MAYREQRQQAIEKAKQGFAPSEIAEMLHVPIRSVQRWIRAAKEDGSLKISDSLQLHITEISNENDPPVNEQEEISHNVLPSTLALLYDAELQTNRWVQALNKLVNQHIKSHQNVREKIELLLTTELNSEEPSFKKIHVLSIALARHTDCEMRAFTVGRSDILTVSQAATILYAQNYMVLKRDDVPELIDLIHSQKEATAPL
jgi:hypothetical protein